MSGNFSESLALVAPRLTGCLATDEQLRALLALAAALPPVHRGGFEYRLGAGPGLDLQQAIDTTGAARARLRRFAGRGRGHLAGTLAMLDGLLEDLVPDEAEAPWLKRLWLEFDATRSRQPRPSWFLTLAQAGAGGEELVRNVDRVFDRLSGASPGPAALETLRHACRPGLGCPPMTDLGLMAARQQRALRLIAPCRDAGEALDWLAALGWPGEQAPVRRWCRSLSRWSDELRVCLDVTDRVQSRIGLEIPVNAARADDPALLGLLEWLVRQGLCREEERSALLAWPGIVTPQDAGGDWPEDLVAESITRAPDDFTALRCKFSHVKVTLEEGRDPVVKAYFGHFETWLRDAAAD